VPHFLTQFSAGDPAVGVAALPKSQLRRARHRAAPLCQAHCERPRGADSLSRAAHATRVLPGRHLCADALADADANDRRVLAGGKATPQLVDLCPSGMTRLSDAPTVEKKGPKYVLDREEKKEGEITDSLFQRMNARTGIASLEDQRMAQQQGASEAEWDDDESDKKNFSPGFD
jgi:hypothetical protein